MLVTKHDDNGARRVPDDLIVEEPLEIRLDDHLVTTTMRTPGTTSSSPSGSSTPRGCWRARR